MKAGAFSCTKMSVICRIFVSKCSIPLLHIISIFHLKSRLAVKRSSMCINQKLHESNVNMILLTLYVGVYWHSRNGLSSEANTKKEFEN